MEFYATRYYFRRKTKKLLPLSGFKCCQFSDTLEECRRRPLRVQQILFSSSAANIILQHISTHFIQFQNKLGDATLLLQSLCSVFFRQHKSPVAHSRFKYRCAHRKQPSRDDVHDATTRKKKWKKKHVVPYLLFRRECLVHHPYCLKDAFVYIYIYKFSASYSFFRFVLPSASSPPNIPRKWDFAAAAHTIYNLFFCWPVLFFRELEEGKNWF